MSNSQEQTLFFPDTQMLYNIAHPYSRQAVPQPDVAQWDQDTLYDLVQRELNTEYLHGVQSNMAGPSESSPGAVHSTIEPPVEISSYFAGELPSTYFDKVDGIPSPNDLPIVHTKATTGVGLVQRQPMTRERKEIEARARRKQREAADRLKSAMKPFLRGKNIRGLADLLHATAEVLEWLETARAKSGFPPLNVNTK